MGWATRREWIGLAVPSLSADLHPSAIQLLWIVDIYGFTLAGSLLTMGALGDRIGRRLLRLIGARTLDPTLQPNENPAQRP